MIWWLAVSMALGQTGPVAPKINSQLYRPTFDSRQTLWTESTGSIDDAHAAGRLFVSYVNDPLVFVDDADGSTTAVVSDALQLDVLPMFSIDRFRFGVDVPVYLFTASQVVGNGSGLGDIALDGRVTILDHSASPVGVALAGRLNLPTATVATSLGASGIGGELMASLDRKVDKLLLATNLGTRLNPGAVALDNVDLGNQFLFRVGGGYEVATDAGVSLDVAGQFNYSSPLGNPAGAPIEALGGGWYRVSDDWVLRAGVGKGITPGIGSPVARAILSLAFEAREVEDSDGDGLVDREDDCPQEPEDPDQYEDEDGCPDPDNDRDGIVDVDDNCPLLAEDIDQFDDEDGCPDLSREIQVAVVDPKGATITNASVQISGRATQVNGVAGMIADLHDGTYDVTAIAEDYVTGSVLFDVPVTSDKVVVRLEPAVQIGTLKVEVMDPDGKHVDAAEWMLDKTEGPALVEGKATLEVFAGPHVLVVRAEGYAPARIDVEVAKEQLTHSIILLQPSKVEVTREKIEIKETVYFETGKAVIKTESHELLSEIANILIDHDEITKVRIEGHTDSRGSASSNTNLSEKRAASVRTFLMQKGIAGDRLESIGYGEDKPVDDRNVAEAWEKNRRVDFYIVERAD